MLELIGEEEVRLEELLAIHLEREESAGERLGFDDSETGEWLRRYQLTFNRTLLRILETLQRAERTRAEPATGAEEEPQRGSESGASRRSAAPGSPARPQLALVT